MRSLQRLAFWIAPPFIALVLVGSYELTRGEGPMGDRVAILVSFLTLAAFIQGCAYRVTRKSHS